MADGVTVILLPLPTSVPPQLLVYHLQFALPPNVPLLTESVTFVPTHTESAEAVMEVGAVENVFTFIVLLTHAVVLHVPSALI